jgi:4-hydroxy-4-methyl-2-oxoglutarate aldolase
LPPVVGYAVTCTVDSTTPGRNHPTQEKALWKATRAAPKPAILVMKDVGPDRIRSCHAGDIISTLSQRLGATALVTDGGVRDLAGVIERAPGFQIFASGLVVSHGVPVIVDVNVPLTIHGLTIRPGDLLHGDANGLVSIPLAIADQVAAQAQKVLARERAMIEFIKSSIFTLEAMGEQYGW